MLYTDIKSEDVLFSLDIGTRTVIGTVGIVKDKKFHIIAEKLTEHEERAVVDGQIHDINLAANAVNEVKTQLEEDLGFELKKVAIAAAGRFLRTTLVNSEIEIDEDREIDKELIRSLELTAVKLAEEEIGKNTDGKLYCVGYSVKNYYLNGYSISNLLSHKGQRISAEIIATFLPRSVVESLYAVTKRIGLSVLNLTLEPIAAMEAAVPKKLRLLNLALVDIGAGTSDIAISSNETISAYGMVSMAGDEVTEAIAQTCLVDFNTAENIKKKIVEKKEVKYIDVLGFENVITYDEAIKIIRPVADKLSEEISKKIIELNGGKPTNAVFLVGGGAHTPLLKELIVKNLNISPQRIAIKGRDSVIDCVCNNNELGSIGVTVLGIALVAMRKFGGDFIDVFLNNTVVSLFNSKNNTVMDAVIQAGINPKILIAKNGQNIRFTLNGSKRVAFGSMGKSSAIKLNGIIASLESEIKENDRIEVVFAQNGNNAKAYIKDYIKKLDSVGFYLNDKVKNLEPLFFVNDQEVGIDHIISEGDDIKTVFPRTVLDYKKFVLKNLDLEFYITSKELGDDYIISEGDNIYSTQVSEEKNDSIQREIALESSVVPSEDNINFNNEPIEISKVTEESIEVFANDNNIILKGKSSYVFVDIFNYVEFDLSKSKGELVLLLNGNKAGFYDKLNDGDRIEIRWK
ncbi:cell division protein FtsA [Clostridium pasteurianum DSM 525 = ATCC 6013]|uniref:Cell division protein FtsA n=1 Tax=Clostridium pasteurianum DSM 525 = ATCC 6013 TaxID=1262449 RepID=A0A0H3J439_CLOPA|nr:cell division protein FtsA [Clostridium pasteurianum]AJA47617.1 cell division protein FtsA [Clostridium pasteurianum DSM 525 = ATCC 6013]AJA51605.1 cell division protein FtsA [Clostridium pasteurianum DSM 525 = ATCC 6013]AOZ74929.1 cell division protein FtsA [Clostridium pasteurianum DSM 525 = ATCC 6013]AOZ78724.1 cell division protein FtsA [Clostridium pasteurianum]ELP58043.1 ATPase [Clostridium pasteurianum DSM 525 = ATCC 6013]